MNATEVAAHIHATHVVIAAAGQLGKLIAHQPPGHDPAAQRSCALLCAHISRHAGPAQTAALARNVLAYFTAGATDAARLRERAQQQLEAITRQANETLRRLGKE